MIGKYKLGQIKYNENDYIVIIEYDTVYLIIDENGPKYTLDIVKNCSENNSLLQSIVDIIKNCKYEKYNLIDFFNKDGVKLQKPIYPPEIWAVGVTYKRQALEHDNDIQIKTGVNENLYSKVYANERAEVFFKGFNRTSVGHNQQITVRGDSKHTMPEAEMVLVLGVDSSIVGYTAGNDLTAWDLELECPLYLNQAKIWDGSCSIGPFIVPIESFGNPYGREIRIKVHRNDKLVLESIGNTCELKRSIEELSYYLTYNNGVQSGSLLFTGTGCVIPHDFKLESNDIVTINIDTVGELINKVEVLPHLKKEYKIRD